MRSTLAFSPPEAVQWHHVRYAWRDRVPLRVGRRLLSPRRVAPDDTRYRSAIDFVEGIHPSALVDGATRGTVYKQQDGELRIEFVIIPHYGYDPEDDEPGPGPSR